MKKKTDPKYFRMAAPHERRERPVYRSEFVIKLQSLREQKRSKLRSGAAGGPGTWKSRYGDFLKREDKIEWLPSITVEPIQKQPRIQKNTVNTLIPVNNTRVSQYILF